MGIFLIKPKKSDELVFWTLQMRDFSAYMQKVISEFETQNPEIKIKWVDVPFSEGEKRTLASILSDNPPDLINLNPDFSTLLAEKGTLNVFSDDELFNIYEDIMEMSKYWRISFNQFSKDFPQSAKIKSKSRRSKKYQEICFRVRKEKRTRLNEEIFEYAFDNAMK